MKDIFYTLLLVLALLGCNKDENKLQIEDLLIDEWTLLSFINELDGISIYQDDLDNDGTITLNIKEDSTYSGNTGRNTYWGTYSLNISETVLIFSNFNTTLVAETEWGSMYVSNLTFNFDPQTQTIDNLEKDFEVSNDTLKIYYSDSEFMKFLRL
jgi:heat shock protein HslJ